MNVLNYLFTIQDTFIFCSLQFPNELGLYEEIRSINLKIDILAMNQGLYLWLCMSDTCLRRLD